MKQQNECDQRTVSLANESIRCPLSLSPRDIGQGGSNPFSAMAIPIDSLDNYYFQCYQQRVMPQFYTMRRGKWTNSLAFEDYAVCLSCLEDEAPAYGLLARNAAIDSVLLASHGFMSSNTFSEGENQSYNRVIADVVSHGHICPRVW